MEQLRAGDVVVAANEASGRLFLDRVSYNFHRRDERTDHIGSTFTFTREGAAAGANASSSAAGVVSVTDNHLMIRTGCGGHGRGRGIVEMVAAADLRVGDCMVSSTGDALSSPPSSASQGSRVVQITAVDKWVGGIINPTTHSGRIVAATPTTAEPNPAGFVVATTVIDSPGHMLLTLVSGPSLVKLASLGFPSQLQQSRYVEWLAELVDSSHVHGQNVYQLVASLVGTSTSTSPSTSTSTSTSIAFTTGASMAGAALAFVGAMCYSAAFVFFDLLIGGGFLLGHFASTAIAVGALITLRYQHSKKHQRKFITTQSNVKEN